VGWALAPEGVRDALGGVLSAAAAARFAALVLAIRGISVEARKRLCALLASDGAGAGPIAAPTATPSASIAAAIAAISLRERICGLFEVGTLRESR
jgi:hypothetical protein